MICHWEFQHHCPLLLTAQPLEHHKSGFSSCKTSSENKRRTNRWCPAAAVNMPVSCNPLHRPWFSFCLPRRQKTMTFAPEWTAAVCSVALHSSETKHAASLHSSLKVLLFPWQDEGKMETRAGVIFTMQKSVSHVISTYFCFLVKSAILLFLRCYKVWTLFIKYYIQTFMSTWMDGRPLNTLEYWT